MFESLFEKLRSIKTNYLRRSPKEKWLFVRDAGILVLRTTGVPVLDPNFKVYWYSYAAGFVILDVTISFIYSVWYYKDRDPIRGMLNIPLYFGVLVPVRLIFTFINQIKTLVFSIFCNNLVWYQLRICNDRIQT